MVEMDIKYKRQIRNLLFEIVYISFILVFLTCFWYLPRKNMEQKRGDLGYQVQGISTLQVTDQVQSREITVDNQDGKGDLMLLFQEDNGHVSSIYYQIVTNGYSSETRYLSENGAIYLLDLNPSQKTTLEVRIWTDEKKIVNGTFLLLPVVTKNQV